MEILGIGLLTILLVVGLVLLTLSALMSLGTAALGIITLLAMVGGIAFGIGFIEGFFGGVGGLAEWIADQMGLQIIALLGL